MKNTFLYLVALSCLTLGSCEKDPVPNPDGTFPDCIVLTGNQTTDIVLTNHVVDPNVPDYCIEGDYDITANLVVEPGVKIQMKNGARIQVIGNGTFNCVGTASERIRIGGESSTLKGQWEVIYIRTNSPENRIEYTDITGGGSHTTYNALVYIDLSGSLSTLESLYAFSASNGLKAGTDDATLGEVSQCDFSLNDLYPISIDAKQIGSIGIGNDGGNNFHQLIEVDAAQLTETTTINRTPFPYLISGVFGINSDVTINPGTSFRFAANAKMIVWPEGTITCIGTPTNKIYFRGLDQTAGSWQGVQFNSSNTNVNRFEHCNFANGGGSSTYLGMITMWTNSNVRVGNSDFTNSEGYAIYNHNQTSNFTDDNNNTWSDCILGYINI
jgi:hypothetical protein